MSEPAPGDGSDLDLEVGLDERDRLYEGPTMADLIDRALRRFPDHTAMVDDRGPVTYAQLADRISRAARVLEAAGVARGSGVAQLATNRVDAWVVQAATYFLGARFVGLHARGSLDDQTFMLTDSGAATLVVDADVHPGRAAQLAARVPTVTSVLTHGRADGAVELWAEAAHLPAGSFAPRARWGDIARLAYTGGTTGRPKGVMLPHRSLVINTLMTLAEKAWPNPIRLVLAAPITHGAGSYVLPVLLRGGTIRLLDHFDADALLDTIEVERYNATMLVPTMLYTLLDHPRTRSADLSSLELVTYGASPVRRTGWPRPSRSSGRSSSRATGRPRRPTPSPPCSRASTRPSGWARSACPTRGSRWPCWARTTSRCRPGQRGEIGVRGPLVMDGYWNRPEETAAAFSGGWLHTGDVAYADDEGYLYIVDRKKEMIITGGFNIYPREVEDVLGSHPAVAAAAVVGVPDEHWGEAVKAVVVARPGQVVDPDELVALVRAQGTAAHAQVGRRGRRHPDHPGRQTRQERHPRLVLAGPGAGRPLSPVSAEGDHVHGYEPPGDRPSDYAVPAGFRFVDAHVHLFDHSVPGLSWGFHDPGWEHPRLKGAWRLDRPAFSVPQYRTLVAGLGVDKMVHVQAADPGCGPVAETAWLQGLADRYGWPNAIVAPGPLTAAGADRPGGPGGPCQLAGRPGHRGPGGHRHRPLERGVAALVDLGGSVDLMINRE